MKTSELTGVALDWAVAKCVYPDLVWGSSIGVHHASHQIVIPHLPEPKCYWNPSTDWAQGGPIIEREGIDLYQSTGRICAAMWENIPGGGRLIAEVKDCPTPLIAAMRCYVVSKLGNDIELPEELK